MGIWFNQYVSVFGESEDIAHFIGFKTNDKTLLETQSHQKLMSMGPIHFSGEQKNVPPFNLSYLSKSYPKLIFAITSQNDTTFNTYRFFLINGKYIEIAAINCWEETKKLIPHMDWVYNLQFKDIIKKYL